MKFNNPLLLLILAILFLSCGSKSEEKKSDFSLNLARENARFHLGDTLKGSLKSKSAAPIDSVVYTLNGKKLQKTLGTGALQYVFKNDKLGRWDLSAAIFSRGEETELKKSITLYNDTPPKIYTYRILATYPHSPTAYTQGLEFHNDTLYESTGQYGESTLRKTDYRTGKVLEMIRLEDSYFAEGITILNNRIYQLTWKEGEGFIYDLDSFQRTGSFSYNKSKQGWGLANDGERIYKSDGTEKIWILNSTTLAEEDYIQTLTNRTVSSQLNELEWVEGKIYANTYQKDGVAIINPENGAIEGLINFQGLRKELSNESDLDPLNDVLNGIAYNRNTGKLYVTGKNWDKLFEVEIVER